MELQKDRNIGINIPTIIHFILPYSEIQKLLKFDADKIFKISVITFLRKQAVNFEGRDLIRGSIGECKRLKNNCLLFFNSRSRELNRVGV